MISISSEAEDDRELTREERLRRVVLVCTNFMRNLSHYRGAMDFPAGWSKGPLVREAGFWRSVVNNALDVSVLEFCKLFGERKGNHAWRRVVTNASRFEAELQSSLKMSAMEFDEYVDQMRHYRDKFVAHLDDDRVMRLPDLSLAKAAVEFYHAYLVDNEAPPGCLVGLFDRAGEFAARFDDEKATSSSIFRRILAKTEKSDE